MRLFSAHDEGLTYAFGHLTTYTSASNTQTYELASASDSKVVGVDINKELDLLVCAYDNKWICSYKLSDGSVIHSICLKKCPSAITIASWTEGTVYLVSDKAGELLIVNANDFTRQARVGGHTGSIITDIELMTCANKGQVQQYLASCDRDEHIRFSQFPHMCNIESYCVGHQSIITSMSSMLISGGGSASASASATADSTVLLVSTSWDHNICLWKCPTGERLDTAANPFKPVAVPADVGADETVEEERQEEEAGDDNESERGGDDYHTMKYDREKAVNVPLKVVAASAGSVHVVAVMYRDCAKLHLLSVRPCADGFEFARSCIIELQSVPSDICFQTQASSNAVPVLLAMMPEPELIVSYSVTSTAGGLQAVVQPSSAIVTAACKAFKTKGKYIVACCATYPT